MVWLPPNEKQTYWLISSSLTLAMTFTLNFQGQIWTLLYLCQKWSDCHKMKSKHIAWTLDLKCDHQIWPWPWHWPWIFKVISGICYISTKSGPIATKRKANKSIFLNENIRISTRSSLKFVPKGPIDKIPALVQIMAWCWPGDKPLSEPMMIILLTHICVTRPQWVKSFRLYLWHLFHDRLRV